MTRTQGIILELRRAEAHVERLRAQLEKITGLTELEGLLLGHMQSEPWARDFNLAGKSFSIDKTLKAQGRLRQKGFADRSDDTDGLHTIRINAAGRKALAEFKKQLQEK